MNKNNSLIHPKTSNPNTGTLVALQYGVHRSPKWDKVRDAHLRAEAECAACEGGKSDNMAMQVHHIFPLQYCVALGRADLELDQRNLITLCQSEVGKPSPNHHLLIGHLGNFESADRYVVRDARKIFHGMSATQIKIDPRWLAKKLRRLKPLDKMTGREKKRLRATMDKVFPVL